MAAITATVYTPLILLILSKGSFSLLNMAVTDRTEMNSMRVKCLPIMKSPPMLSIYAPYITMPALKVRYFGFLITSVISTKQRGTTSTSASFRKVNQ